MITIMTTGSLQTYLWLFAVTGVAGLFVCAALLVYQKPFRQKAPLEASPAMLLFLVLAGITVYRLFSGYAPDLEDAVYEIVLSNLERQSIMSGNPFLPDATGQMPIRFRILGLSSIYTALITVSQQSVYMILCKLVPLCVWACSMLVYAAFAQKLFPDNPHKRWLFISFAALFYLATAGIEGAVGWRLFFAGFSGETIRALVLIPYMFYVCWQKKWPAAFLGILAEVCLVWTTYGLGYCVWIFICMFGVQLLRKRRAEHAA